MTQSNKFENLNDRLRVKRPGWHSWTSLGTGDTFYSFKNINENKIGRDVTVYVMHSYIESDKISSFIVLTVNIL